MWAIQHTLARDQDVLLAPFSCPYHAILHGGNTSRTSEVCLGERFGCQLHGEVQKRTRGGEPKDRNQAWPYDTTLFGSIRPGVGGTLLLPGE